MYMKFNNNTNNTNNIISNIYNLLNCKCNCSKNDEDINEYEKKLLENCDSDNFI